MDFNYRKQDNHKLFSSLAENPKFGILQPQNYIPLYDRYFSLTPTNFNNIILNNQWSLYSLKSQESSNIFRGVVKREEKDTEKKDTEKKDTEKKETKKIFLKFSPLLDPTKYLFGKYDISNQNLLNLPSYVKNECDPKIQDPNNAAYIDGFFTYLSSQLLHKHAFVHGLDFYGSFLAKHTNFRYNITDDLEYLQDSEFFHKNNNVLFELENNANGDLLNADTRNYKKKLNFLKEDDVKKDGTDGLNLNILTLSDITDLTQLDSMFITETNQKVTTHTTGAEPELLFQGESVVPRGSSTNVSSNTSASTCSSRSSNTENNDEDKDLAIDDNDNVNTDQEKDEEEEAEDEDDEDDDEGEEDKDKDEAADEAADDRSISTESEEEEDIIAKIKNFPVQVISLECCDDTLDELMAAGDITAPMWDSIVLQILFSLITFQNAFGLTHNDLHTNNIMFIKTDKKFLYYKLNHVYYKVPTYGRLFKIIDFGRAIYKFRGQLLCSDSYHPKGDAATQYNCEPYFNDKKPRLDPNYSFDLCRLGCALYDYIVDEPMAPIMQIMLNWCNDDKGRNILYKKNGDERYPDFKLYKMIARTVHNHLPATVLNNSYFDQYIIPKKDVNKKALADLLDIDAIPSYI